MAGLFVHSLRINNGALFLSGIYFLVHGNGNDFTQILGSNNWDYIIQWNLLACRCIPKEVCNILYRCRDCPAEI